MNADPWNIRRALESGEFIPYFQPLVSIGTGRLAGFEALTRWNHPEFGLLSPDTFIPTAERDGWIGHVMVQILQKAFAAISAYGTGLRLAFNVSPLQLKDAALSKHIWDIADDAGFSLQQATMEVTETALAENIPLARTIAGDLKAMGCRIALDDFGTGYSSLFHLKSLPFDELKVDRSFVNAMTDQRESRKIVAAVVGLGQSLGLDTAAEGVETQEQADILLWLGCDVGQGWIYGKPQPAEALPAMIEEWQKLPIARAPQELSPNCLEGLHSWQLAQLKAVYDGSPVGLGFVDRNLKYINVNRRLAKMHGVPVEEHRGKTVPEIIPDLYPVIEPFLERAFDGKGVCDVEIHEPDSRDRSGRTFLVSCQPAFDEGGEVVGVSCAVRDFTARKAAEDKLRQFESIIEELDEMVIVVDRQYRYVLANRAFLENMGARKDKLVGRLIPEFADQDTFERMIVPRLQQCFAGKHVLFEMEYTFPHIGRRVLSVSHSAIEAAGEVQAAACVFRDVTESNRIEPAGIGRQDRRQAAGPARPKTGS